MFCNVAYYIPLLVMTNYVIITTACLCIIDTSKEDYRLARVYRA